jgi:adenosylcobinamide-GDP ribazoletransferase
VGKQPVGDKNLMRAFIIAAQFLTRLPMRAEPGSPRQIARSYFYYPVIGFLIGVAAVLLRLVLITVLPLSFSIVLVLTFLIWITGGLHEDGLADVADGMGGGWTPAQRLTIMKDSHIGAFGSLIVVLAVLAKYAALTSMSPLRVGAAIITAQTLGRWAFLPMGYFNPHAGEGLGSEFMKAMTLTAVVVGSALSAGEVLLVAGIRGGVAFCVASAIVGIASRYFRRRIGGVTGDCFGATFQFVEIATYAVFLV